MKKRFFKKLKKIILTLSCILSCLVIFSVSVSADSVFLNSLNFYSSTFAIPGLNGAYSSGVEFFDYENLSDFIQTSTKYYQTTTKYYTNANEIDDRFYFKSKSNSIILRKNMTFSGSLTGFHFGWIVITDSNTGSLGYIYLNDNVNLDLYLHFIDKEGHFHRLPVLDFTFSNTGEGLLEFNCPGVPVDSVGFMFSLVYNVNDSNLIDETAKMPLGWFIRKNRVYCHDVSLQNFNCDFNYSYPPLSEQPIYSKPSTGGIDNTTSQEQIIVDNSVQDAQDEFGKLSNSIANIVKDTKLYNSILGVRYMFERLLQESPFLSDILVVSLTCGIVLLFSNFIVNRRRD